MTEEKQKEKPYIYIKKLIKIGKSFYFLVPQAFIKRCGKMKGQKVIVEENMRSIIIRPFVGTGD